jgi:hypothetical protein
MGGNTTAKISYPLKVIMAGTYINISLDEFNKFVTELGFSQIQVDGTNEAVFGRIIGKGLCLRVYSGIVGRESRGCGEDAIRCVIFWRENKESPPVKVSGTKRVHRVHGWRNNLLKRIEAISAEQTPLCQCGRPMVKRQNKITKSYFWSCAGYTSKACTRTKDLCEESPNGLHEYEPDIEYDITGKTVNCKYCGESPSYPQSFTR